MPRSIARAPSPLARTLPRLGCRWALAGVVLAALAVGGCVPLQSYEQIAFQLDAASLVDVGGSRVHVEAAGEGFPLLLVHGFGGSTYSWRHVLPELAEQRRVIAVDLYGFGFTERPQQLGSYSREGQVELLVGLLDALGIEQTDVMGHSYGGGLAMTLAAYHPERVRSLVLVDSTAPEYALERRNALAALPPVTWGFTRVYALRPKVVRRALERSWHDDSLITDRMVSEYLERLKVEGAARAYRGLTTPLIDDDPRPVRFEDIEQPVLIVWGEEDALIGPQFGRKASERMPRARFVSLPDAGHSPMEESPEAFLAVVEPFLAAPEEAVGSSASVR